MSAFGLVSESMCPVLLASLLPTSVYFQYSGNDLNNNGSSTSPFKTLGRVSRGSFKPILTDEAWTAASPADYVAIYIMDDMVPNAGHAISGNNNVSFIHFQSAYGTMVRFCPYGLTFGVNYYGFVSIHIS